MLKLKNKRPRSRSDNDEQIDFENSSQTALTWFIPGLELTLKRLHQYKIQKKKKILNSYFDFRTEVQNALFFLFPQFLYTYCKLQNSVPKYVFQTWKRRWIDWSIEERLYMHFKSINVLQVGHCITILNAERCEHQKS